MSVSLPFSKCAKREMIFECFFFSFAEINICKYKERNKFESLSSGGIDAKLNGVAKRICVSF